MKKLPRVPDAHGDVVDGKMFSDLYIRTSWVDANVALAQIEKVSGTYTRMPKLLLRINGVCVDRRPFVVSFHVIRFVFGMDNVGIDVKQSAAADKSARISAYLITRTQTHREN